MRRRRLCPRQLGSFIQANSKRLTICLSLALLAICSSLNSAKFDAELTNWIQRTERVERELQTINSAVGPSAGSASLLVLQAAKQQTKTAANRYDQNQDLPSPVLSVNSLMVHLEALAIATHVTIDLYDVTWSLRDICFSPTPPDYEGLLVNQMLDQLMPCAITTPLDCFWEGAKLLGPEQDLRLGSIGPKLKWTSLNPKLMVEARRRDHPHASFPYDSLLDWMRRVGITSGYLEKPCLDPSDPNCPESAPNKLSGELPDVGHQLTGGCYGLAANQMHWLEDEILGGVKRNRTGVITEAEALQSSIQLMDEQDVYDYWRKTSKVQDINNWSTEKAKLVLDSWQTRFKEELDQFTRSSIASNAFKIYAMTPKSMLEPIDLDSVANTTSVRLAIVLMVLFTLVTFPRFERGGQQEEEQSYESTASNRGESAPSTTITTTVGRSKSLLLASVTCLIAIITFTASLGLSSFMNLPFNLATTQILPPIALYYGFKQSLLVANIYSRQFKSAKTQLADLTTECLNELLPIVLIESVVFIVCLTVASVFQVPATRVFVCQAITYFTMATFTTVLLLPSLMTGFILNEISYDCDNNNNEENDDGHSSKNKNGGEKLFSIEEQYILSRIQDDLMNIKADQTTRQTPDLVHSGLPDLVLCSSYDRIDSNNGHYYSQTQIEEGSLGAEKGKKDDHRNDDEKTLSNIYDDNLNTADQKSDLRPDQRRPRLIRLANCFQFTQNVYIQTILLLIRLSIFIIIFSWANKVKFGLQVKDIIMRDTAEYDSFHLQDKYFPIYNVFAITKGAFDYPNNQRLLYEYFKRIEQVDGIVRDEANLGKPKFWLAYFRDWLVELQETFDLDRNKSAISNEGWTQDASDNAKLAYKLLAQTGKLDNPIDKNQVESNRLVDKNGIINRQAFYYYLTAWVMNDAYSYSNSRANFKPEPKTWNDNPDDLRIERARPISYSQIPLLMKLPAERDSLRTIVELRTISQAFEQLNLPNFLTGIPFVFWDQFLNLDLLYFATVAITTASLYLIVSLMTSDFILSAIILGPMVTTLLEIYGLMGIFSIQFNNVFAVMILSTIGTTVVQTIYLTNSLVNSGDDHEDNGSDLVQRLSNSLKKQLRTVITTLLLFYLCGLVFRFSKIDFMIKYSHILLCMATLNAINSLVVTPILLRIFGSMLRLDLNRKSSRKSKAPSSKEKKAHIVCPPCPRREKKIRIHKKYTRSGGSKRQSKKRVYPRVQSEISLSTISEEP